LLVPRKTARQNAQDSAEQSKTGGELQDESER
jgi:hypothetical protein